MPNHIPWAAIGAPYALWMKNVSHKNAPGAMSAMAFEVNPVRPSVALLSDFSFDDISVSFSIWLAKQLKQSGRRCPRKTFRPKTKKSSAAVAAEDFYVSQFDTTLYRTAILINEEVVSSPY